MLKVTPSSYSGGQDSLIARSLGVSDRFIIGIIVVLLLILIGVFVFDISGFLKSSGKRITGGLGVTGGIGPEGYIDFEGGMKEGYGIMGLGKNYPKGWSKGPYQSIGPHEGLLPNPRTKNGSYKGFSPIWDSDQGQRSTAATGPWSTIMAYQTAMYGQDLPKSRYSYVPTWTKNLD